MRSILSLPLHLTCILLESSELLSPWEPRILASKTETDCLGQHQEAHQQREQAYPKDMCGWISPSSTRRPLLVPRRRIVPCTHSDLHYGGLLRESLTFQYVPEDQERNQERISHTTCQSADQCHSNRQLPHDAFLYQDGGHCSYQHVFDSCPCGDAIEAKIDCHRPCCTQTRQCQHPWYSFVCQRSNQTRHHGDGRN